jgi:ABC-type amino acid transport substrate-binding protein
MLRRGGASRKGGGVSLRETKLRWLVALMAAVFLLGAACGGDGEEEDTGGGDGGGGAQVEEFPADTTMGKIQEKGEIVIGVKYDVPPFGFDNPQSGEVEGFDVEMGKIIAERLGVEPVFEEAISDNRIPFLQDGTVDIILSTMTITTDRAVEIDFSRPYFIAHGRILVPEGSDIQGIEDLGGKKVCTGLGSTYEATIKEQAPDAELKLVESYSECFELVQNGAVDAVSTDDVILTGMIIQDDSLQMVGEEMTKEPYGIGVPDEDEGMSEFTSQVIEDTFEDGTWDDLYEEWVGQYTNEEPDHPENYTLDDAYKLFPCDEFCKEAKEETGL